MDFSWMPYFGGFWLFPLLCLLFMAVMMIGCGGMLFRSRHGAHSGDGHGTACHCGSGTGEPEKR
jgi:hypothetical protein